MTDRLKVSLTNMSTRYKEGIYALTTQIFNTIDGGGRKSYYISF